MKLTKSRLYFQISAIGLACNLCLLPGGGLPAFALNDNAYTLSAHGRSIGKISIQNYMLRPVHSVEVLNGSGAAELVTEINHVFRSTRQGQPFEMSSLSRFVENPKNGKPLNFSYRYDLGEQRLIEVKGEVRGEFLDLRLITDQGVTWEKARVKPEQFLFPDGKGLRDIYQKHAHDGPGAGFSFQTLSLGVLPEIVNSDVRSLGDEKTVLSQGKPKRLHKFEVTNPANRKNGFYEWRDAEGKLYKASSVGGDGMEMIYASRAETRDASRFDELDLMQSSAILTNLIAQPRRITEALYRISSLSGASNALRDVFPQSDTQQIAEPLKQSSALTLKPATDSPLLSKSLLPSEALPDGTIYLKVLAKEPSDASATYPVEFSEKLNPEYLQSNSYIQSNDPEIHRIALETVGFDPLKQEKRSYYAARKLQQWVYRNIVQKDFSLGFASAKDTMLSRQGDCTEHAVLLAALTRSLGIPTRVTVGLIYQQDGNSKLGRFVYHMWDEVYIGNARLGEWIPLDATLPETVVDATHLKLADSPLSSVQELISLSQTVANLAGRLKIDVLQALSPTQSTLSVGENSGSLPLSLPKLDIQSMDIKALSRQAIQRFSIPASPASLSLKTADGLLTSGLELLAKGDYPGARSAFEKSLGRCRQAVEFYRMGEKLAAIGMYAMAKDAFKQAEAKDPRFSGRVAYWIQDALPRQALPENLNHSWMLALQPSLSPSASKVALKTLMEKVPAFTPAYRRLAEMVSDTEALGILKKAIAIAPGDFRNHEALGDLRAQSKYTGASSSYRQAEQLLQQTASPVVQPWRENLLGKVSLAQGAELLFRYPQSAAGWLKVGKGLNLQNRPEEAAQAFGNAVLLSPDLQEAKMARFDIALAQSDWPTLLALQDTVESMSGSNALAATLWGQYQMRRRHYASAVHSLQCAITLTPLSADAYLSLSEVYSRLAEQAANAPESRKNNPSSWERQAQSILHQGILTVQKTRRPELSLALASRFIYTNRWTEALKLAEAVLSENPANAHAYLVQGKALFYSGETGKAKHALEASLVLNPNNADALLSLGQVAQEVGREAEAMDFYERAIQADPLSGEAVSVYRQLMGQQGFKAQKLGNYWYLSPDEYDYLVQLCYQVKNIKQNSRDYLQAFLTIPGKPGHLDLSVEGIHSIEAGKNEINRISGQANAQYHTLQETVVPKRFLALHQEVSKLLQDQLQGFLVARERYWVLESAPGEAEQFLTAEMARIQKTGQRLTQDLDRVASKMPPVAYQSFRHEVDADAFRLLDQTIDSLAEKLAGQTKEKKMSSVLSPKP